MYGSSGSILHWILMDFHASCRPVFLHNIQDRLMCWVDHLDYELLETSCLMRMMMTTTTTKTQTTTPKSTPTKSQDKIPSGQSPLNDLQFVTTIIKKHSSSYWFINYLKSLSQHSPFLFYHIKGQYLLLSVWCIWSAFWPPHFYSIKVIARLYCIPLSSKINY